MFAFRRLVYQQNQFGTVSRLVLFKCAKASCKIYVYQLRRFIATTEKQNDKYGNSREIAFSGTLPFLLAVISYWLWNKSRSTLPTTYALSKDDDQESKPKKRKFDMRYFIADIVEQVGPSVVFIQSEVRHPYFNQAVVHMNTGSGFLVDKEDGIIITNAHVITNSRMVKVKLKDGTSLDGIVEFVNDQIDLATVRVPVKQLRDIDSIPLADSRQCRTGEWVLTVGAPFSLDQSVTVGVVSSRSRSGSQFDLNSGIDYIQTDASINSGNSGGPLLNVDGEAIGINTLKMGEGISFAIPSEYAAEFLRQAKALRHRDRSRTSDPFELQQNVPVPTRKKFLGLTMITLTPNLIEQSRARNPNFPNVKSGVLIYRVVLGSPAHIGGLQTGDIIVAVNGKEISRPSDVYRAMESSDELQFRLRRGSQEIFFKVQPQNAD